MADLTVRASLRRLHSPDAWDLRTFQPADPLNFGILVQAMVGPPDGPGEESFDFILCTPQWIAHELERDDVVWGRARLIVSGYSHEALERTVLKLCQRIEGKDWTEVAERLSRWTTWEFEDYRDTRGT
jgi:hypothetical protein